MPTMANAQLPAPKDWSEFEDIVADCLRIRWKNRNVSRIGRNGQAQHGVDLYGNDDSGRRAGVQCKLTERNLNPDRIMDEIAKAERFLPALEIYYIATTAPRDANLQAKLHQLSEERKEMGKFPVQLLFWEDLIQDLAADPHELNKHYPEISLAQRKDETGRKARISKKTWLVVTVVLFLILLSFPDPAITRAALTSSGHILLAYKWGLLLFFILLGFAAALLKISDSKFNEERKAYNEPRQYESMEKRPVTTTVFDDHVFENGKWTVIRQVSLRNATEFDIRNITGKVIFYDNGYKVDEVCFHEEAIPPGKGIRIEKAVAQHKQKEWNEFQTEIIHMQHREEAVRNVKVFGIYVIKNYFLILNRYHYFRIFGKRLLPYEITWLRTESRYLWDSFIGLTSGRYVINGLNNGLFGIRLRKMAIRITSVLLLGCCLAYAAGSFFVASFEILVCWYQAFL